MSLAALNWKYVGSQGFATGTVDAALAALYTLGTAVTYADGSGRTEGSGSAWTYTGNRYQNAGVNEALYPVSPTSTLNMRVLIAGQATGGTKTPTMMGSDTSATVVILAGITKNAGAWNAWDNANPFTSGQNSGLARCWPGSAGSGTVYLYESQEAMLVLFTTTGGGVYGLLVGAWIDPESPDVANDAESDGKLYAISMSSVANVMSTTWWTANSSSDFLRDNNTSNQCKCRVFTPGGSSMLNMEPCLAPRTAMTSSGLKSRSGRWGRHALAMRFNAASPNDQTAGRAREICAFSDAQVPSKEVNAGTTIGYCVSASTTSAVDALILLA